MQRATAVWGVLLLTAAGCGATKTVTKTVTLQSAQTFGLGPPSEIVQFGYVRSLRPKGAGFVMRFDPAFLLSGVTANTAAAEDGVVPKGEPVPNDNYRLNEKRRALTFVVPANAHVTVITAGPRSSPISVSELARIVNGGKHLKLFESLASGVWIRYHIDTVRSLDQQYQP